MTKKTTRSSVAIGALILASISLVICGPISDDGSTIPDKTPTKTASSARQLNSIEPYLPHGDDRGSSGGQSSLAGGRSQGEKSTARYFGGGQPSQSNYNYGNRNQYEPTKPFQPTKNPGGFRPAAAKSPIINWSRNSGYNRLGGYETKPLYRAQPEPLKYAEIFELKKPIFQSKKGKTVFSFRIVDRKWESIPEITFDAYVSESSKNHYHASKSQKHKSKSHPHGPKSNQTKPPYPTSKQSDAGAQLPETSLEYQPSSPGAVGTGSAKSKVDCILKARNEAGSQHRSESKHSGPGDQQAGGSPLGDKLSFPGSSNSAADSDTTGKELQLKASGPSGEHVAPHLDSSHERAAGAANSNSLSAMINSVSSSPISTGSNNLAPETIEASSPTANSSAQSGEIVTGAPTKPELVIDPKLPLTPTSGPTSSVESTSPEQAPNPSEPVAPLDSTSQRATASANPLAELMKSASESPAPSVASLTEAQSSPSALVANSPEQSSEANVDMRTAETPEISIGTTLPPSPNDDKIPAPTSADSISSTSAQQASIPSDSTTKNSGASPIETNILVSSPDITNQQQEATNLTMPIANNIQTASTSQAPSTGLDDTVARESISVPTPLVVDPPLQAGDITEKLGVKNTENTSEPSVGSTSLVPDVQIGTSRASESASAPISVPAAIGVGTSGPESDSATIATIESTPIPEVNINSTQTTLDLPSSDPVDAQEPETSAKSISAADSDSSVKPVDSESTQQQAILPSEPTIKPVASSIETTLPIAESDTTENTNSPTEMPKSAPDGLTASRSPSETTSSSPKLGQISSSSTPTNIDARIDTGSLSDTSSQGSEHQQTLPSGDLLKVDTGSLSDTSSQGSESPPIEITSPGTSLDTKINQRASQNSNLLPAIFEPTATITTGTDGSVPSAVVAIPKLQSGSTGDIVTGAQAVPERDLKGSELPSTPAIAGSVIVQSPGEATPSFMASVPATADTISETNGDARGSGSATESMPTSDTTNQTSIEPEGEFRQPDATLPIPKPNSESLDAQPSEKIETSSLSDVAIDMSANDPDTSRQQLPSVAPTSSDDSGSAEHVTHPDEPTRDSSAISIETNTSNERAAENTNPLSAVLKSASNLTTTDGPIPEPTLVSNPLATLPEVTIRQPGAVPENSVGSAQLATSPIDLTPVKQITSPSESSDAILKGETSENPSGSETPDISDQRAAESSDPPNTKPVLEHHDGTPSGPTETKSADQNTPQLELTSSSSEPANTNSTEPGDTSGEFLAEVGDETLADSTPQPSASIESGASSEEATALVDAIMRPGSSVTISGLDSTPHATQKPISGNNNLVDLSIQPTSTATGVVTSSSGPAAAARESSSPAAISVALNSGTGPTDLPSKITNNDGKTIEGEQRSNLKANDGEEEGDFSMGGTVSIPGTNGEWISFDSNNGPSVREARSSKLDTNL